MNDVKSSPDGEVPVVPAENDTHTHPCSLT